MISGRFVLTVPAVTPIPGSRAVARGRRVARRGTCTNLLDPKLRGARRAVLSSALAGRLALERA